MERITVEEVRALLDYMSRGYKVPKVVEDTIYEVGVKEIEDKGKVVIAKRDPDIQKGNIQGYYVKIVDGNTIHMRTSTEIHMLSIPLCPRKHRMK